MAITVANLLAETDTAVTAHVTASISPSAGKLYILAVQGKATSPGPTPTVTGCGMTWVLIRSVDTNNRRVSVFRAMKASGVTPGTLTISFSSSVDNASFHLSEWSSVDTTGTDGSGAIVQNGGDSGTTNTTGTANLAAFGSGSNAAYAVFGHNSAENATPESGYTELGDTFLGDTGMISEWKVGQDLTINATWASSTNWRSVSLEIKFAAVTTTPVNVTDSGSGDDVSTSAAQISASELIAPPDTITTLLLHGEGADGVQSFLDSAQGHVVTAVGNTNTYSAQKVFGISSIFFDGQGDWLTIPNGPEFDLGSSDFTFDTRWRYTSVNAHRAFISTDTYTLYWNTAGQINFTYTGLDSVGHLAQWNWSPSINTWYHVAFVCRNGFLTVYINGGSLGSSSVLGGGIKAPTTSFFIGAKSDGTLVAAGFMDEFRYSRGFAQWSANFTPPAAAYSDPAPGGATDGATVIVPLSKSGTDSGVGSDASSLEIIVFKSGVDSGTSSEISSLLSVSNPVEVGLGIEIVSTTAAAPVADSGLGIESTASYFTPFSAFDSGSSNDISSFAFTASDSGSSVDASAFTVAPLSLSDSGSESDASSLVSRYPTTDAAAGSEISTASAAHSRVESGTDSEISALVSVGTLVTDSGLGVEDRSVSTGLIKNVSDNGLGDEIATLKAVSAVTDSSGLDTEAGAISQKVTDAGAGSDVLSAVFKMAADSGTGSEISTLPVPIFVSDAGTADDISSSVRRTMVDSGTSTDTSTGTATYSLVDSGVTAQISSMTGAIQGTDIGQMGNEIATGIAKVFAADTGDGNEIALRLITGVTLFRADTGKGTDYPHATCELQR